MLLNKHRKIAVALTMGVAAIATGCGDESGAGGHAGGEVLRVEIG